MIFNIHIPGPPLGEFIENITYYSGYSPPHSKEKLLLTNDDIYDNDPAFSPNGKQIVFRSKRTEHDELWIMDAGGKNDYHASAPFWEPNRNLISFASKRKGNYSIFTIKPDGTGLKQLTNGARDEMWHSCSPDGNWIAYDSTDEDGNYDIYFARFDGSNVKRLTADKRAEMAPVFVRPAK